MDAFNSLLNHLKNRGVLKNKLVFDAFKKIDRKYFVPEDLREFAYDDVPLPIGEEQTISQPYTVFFMLDLLSVKEGENVLDVGSGSGYTTALLSMIVGEKGKVVGVERIPKLIEMGKNNLSRYNFKNTEIYKSGNIIGRPEDSPYDKILVSAVAKKIPEDLVIQLKNGGTMIIPINGDICKIYKKSDSYLDIEKYPGFSFVPLITKK